MVGAVDLGIQLAWTELNDRAVATSGGHRVHADEQAGSGRPDAVGCIGESAAGAELLQRRGIPVRGLAATAHRQATDT